MLCSHCLTNSLCAFVVAIRHSIQTSLMLCPHCLTNSLCAFVVAIRHSIQTSLMFCPHCLTNSTLRFSALFDGVLFGAIGLDAPAPSVVSISIDTPNFTSSAFTDVARRFDKSRFVASLPRSE